ncbi:TIGR04222 domain-containing membrane protein [Nocardia sp. NPDC048505]|uniref:TIGR04222 domain-containing membrane protein n=1 Tax=unclassified Nocardia TaxID=2637762 RepID=UPI0034064178
MGVLFLSVAAALLVVIAALLLLPASLRSDAEPSTADLGFLNGGDRGAMSAAVTTLYLDGVLDRHRRTKEFRHSDVPLPADADPLERAVYADLGAPARLRVLRRRRRTRAELAQGIARLRAAGLVPGRARRRLAVTIALLLLPAAVVAQLVAGEVTVPIVLASAVLVVSAWALVLFVRRTLAGRRYLRQVRAENQRVLDEWRSPDDPAVIEVPAEPGDPETEPARGWFMTPRSRFKRMVALGMTADLTVAGGAPTPDFAPQGSGWQGWNGDDDHGGGSSWSVDGLFGGDGAGAASGCSGGGGGGGCGGGGGGD